MKSDTNYMLWIGWIITGLCVLFNVVDAGMKIAKAEASMSGSEQLGWPPHQVQTIGIIYIICTILYAIPATAVLGAILITAYLGGAVAIMLRANSTYLFPLVFGIFVWVGVYLRSDLLRRIIPLMND